MKYLLDTNICIYIIKKQPVEIIDKFRNTSIGDVGISSITLAELYYGVEKSQHKVKNQKALDEFILPLVIEDFDNYAAAIYGKIRTYLENKGTPIGSLDMLIAAHAVRLNVTLVTNNTKEFSRVPNLKIENWV